MQDVFMYRNLKMILIFAQYYGGYGGMYGGQGVSDVIFGSFNPTGLTSQPWYLGD